MAKAVEAFRTISEVADELAVQKHVLRFWENKFPQIRPMKRGGGRRYYRPDDLDLLRGIRFLLHREGYTIKGVQKILREQGLDHVKSCWHVPPPKQVEPAPSVQPATPARKLRQETSSGRALSPPKSPGARSPAGAKEAFRKDKAAPLEGRNFGRDRNAASRASELHKQLRALAAELQQCRLILRGEDGEREMQKPASARARAGR